LEANAAVLAASPAKSGSVTRTHVSGHVSAVHLDEVAEGSEEESGDSSDDDDDDTDDNEEDEEDDEADDEGTVAAKQAEEIEEKIVFLASGDAVHEADPDDDLFLDDFRKVMTETIVTRRSEQATVGALDVAIPLNRKGVLPAPSGGLLFFF
jgi:hypothetical protein